MAGLHEFVSGELKLNFLACSLKTDASHLNWAKHPNSCHLQLCSIKQ